MGLVLKELLLYKEAEEVLLLAIEADPQTSDAYKILAAIYQYVFFDLTKAAMYHHAVLSAEPHGTILEQCIFAKPHQTFLLSIILGLRIIWRGDTTKLSNITPKYLN